MKRFVSVAALAAVAALTVGSGKAASRPNWLATINVTQTGTHVLGNPQAKVKLTEYVSYTCSHCADFQNEADAAIKLAYVQPGKISFEIKHFIRDPVDLAVAMLTNCGNEKYFFQRHNDFLANQEKWLAKVDTVSESQQQRWYNGKLSARMQAVAHDFGFYQIMEKRGYSIAAVNRCLADEGKAATISNQTVRATEAGVHSTPSFAINGIVLAGTHSWTDLNTQLAVRF